MGEPMVARTLHLTVEIDREDDGRWIAEVPEIPGVIVYGDSEQAAVNAAKGLALNVIGDRLTKGEDPLNGHPTKDSSSVAADFNRIEFEPALAV
jgi:predicted RNase H-like HicB family nuclease